MTTIIPFQPSNLKIPTFNCTLDGNSYTVKITWNVSAQRYYINIYDVDGNWVLTTPLVQTSPSIVVTDGVYDPLRRVFTVTLADSSVWPIACNSANLAPGTIVDFTLENFDPPVLNALWRSLFINDTSFSFPLANDPGAINILGTVGRYLDMAGRLFNSTLIYRNGAFEVTP